jgi:hypothetical protein
VLFRVRLFIYDGNNLLEVEANPNSALLGILCCLEVAYQLIISTTGRQDVKFVLFLLLDQQLKNETRVLTRMRNGWQG